MLREEYDIIMETKEVKGKINSMRSKREKKMGRKSIKKKKWKLKEVYDQTKGNLWMA